jgi:hypothetical protein
VLTVEMAASLSICFMGRCLLSRGSIDWPRPGSKKGAASIAFTISSLWTMAQGCARTPSLQPKFSSGWLTLGFVIAIVVLAGGYALWALKGSSWK